MPIYEYACQSCGKVTDVLQKVNDPGPEKCESCGAVGPMNRMVSRTSFVLKGGGWYSDLYGSTKKDGTASSTAPAPSGSSPTTSSTGPAAAGATTATPTPAAAPAASTDKK